MKLSVLWFLAALLAVATESIGQTFHTSPACWKESRISHHGPARSGVANLGERITVDRTDTQLPKEVIYSPNRAYAASVKHPDRSRPGPWNAEVLVDNERAYLVRIKLTDLRTIQEMKWLNEKLLFLRVWWGRIEGTDFIVDVERESIIYEERFTDGAIAFRQFQQCKSEQWKDKEMCRCYGQKE